MFKKKKFPYLLVSWATSCFPKLSYSRLSEGNIDFSTTLAQIYGTWAKKGLLCLKTKPKGYQLT